MDRGDSPSEIRNMILSDKFLTYSYIRVYQTMLNQILKNKRNLNQLKIVELGAAGGISDLIFPNAFKSDVVYSNDLSLICDATMLSFRDSSIDVLILKDAFHHLPDLNIFFNEAIRVLHKDSLILIADPNWNLISQFIYRFFHPEPFNKYSLEWKTNEEDPWHSNQALLWIVFKRDLELFKKKYDFFEVSEIGQFGGLNYIFSGGVFKRNFISSKFLIFLEKIETKFPFINRLTATTRIISIKIK